MLAALKAAPLRLLSLTIEEAERPGLPNVLVPVVPGAVFGVVQPLKLAVGRTPAEATTRLPTSMRLVAPMKR